MSRYPPLTLEYINQRLNVDIENGSAKWVDATKHHQNLVGTLAGHARLNRAGKKYWVIRIDGIPYKRAQIILFIKSGEWPTQTVDHINGDSLDDRAVNLRHASITENSWNHKSRKKQSPLPMGVRLIPTSGRFHARITKNKIVYCLGSFISPEAAYSAYAEKRKELFGEFS